MYDLFYLTSSTLALLSNLVSQDVLIRLIRFVSRFTVHWYNAIYFSTTFNIPYKRFTNFFCILRFGYKEGQDCDREQHISGHTSPCLLTTGAESLIHNSTPCNSTSGLDGMKLVRTHPSRVGVRPPPLVKLHALILSPSDIWKRLIRIRTRSQTLHIGDLKSALPSGF